MQKVLEQLLNDASSREPAQLESLGYALTDEYLPWGSGEEV